MTWGMVAVGGATLGGAYLASQSAKGAAKDQRAGTQAGIGEQRRQFDLTRSDTAPYRQAGVNALEQLTGQVARNRENFDANAYLAANPDVAAHKTFATNPWEHYSLYGSQEGRQFTYTPDAQSRLGQVGEMDRPVTAEDVMQDPGYAFGLQQGQQALDRKIAAMGGRVSGAALKAAARFGTDYGATGFNAAYQRRQDRLNRLQQLAGVGQTATNASAAAGGQAANAISGLLSAQGNANGAARMAQANIWGNAGNQLAALYGRNSGVGPGSGAYTDPSSLYAQNGSDIGWGP